MSNRPIKVNDSQKTEIVAIFAHGARETNYHIRKILSTGRSLFTLAGTKITLGKAIKRRRKCIHGVKQALRGFVL